VVTQRCVVGELSVLVGDLYPPWRRRLAATVKQLPQELSDKRPKKSPSSAKPNSHTHVVMPGGTVRG
jgi:hypothetical protein